MPDRGPSWCTSSAERRTPRVGLVRPSEIVEDVRDLGRNPNGIKERLQLHRRPLRRHDSTPAASVGCDNGLPAENPVGIAIVILDDREFAGIERDDYIAAVLHYEMRGDAGRNEIANQIPRTTKNDPIEGARSERCDRLMNYISARVQRERSENRRVQQVLRQLPAGRRTSPVSATPRDTRGGACGATSARARWSWCRPAAWR